MSTKHIQRRRMARLLFIAVLFSWMFTDVHAQQVTISNNLLYDAWLTPNLRVGLRMSPHWSAGLTGGFRPWPTNDETTPKWRHLLISPDLRYWTDSVNVHHFFGVNLIYSHFNVAEVKFPLGYLWLFMAVGTLLEYRGGDRCCRRIYPIPSI